jgi:hypothetical protein
MRSYQRGRHVLPTADNEHRGRQPRASRRQWIAGVRVAMPTAGVASTAIQANAPGNGEVKPGGYGASSGASREGRWRIEQHIVERFGGMPLIRRPFLRWMVSGACMGSPQHQARRVDLAPRDVRVGSMGADSCSEYDRRQRGRASGLKCASFAVGPRPGRQS